MKHQNLLMILCVLFGLAGISYGIFSHNSKNVATDTQATVADEEQIAPETEKTTDVTEESETPTEWVVTADKTEFLYRNERFGFEILFPKVFEDLRVEVEEPEEYNEHVGNLNFYEPTTNERLFGLTMFTKDYWYNDVLKNCQEEGLKWSCSRLESMVAFETDKYVAQYWSGYEA